MNETLKDSAIRDMRSAALKQGQEIETLRAERLQVKERLVTCRAEKLRLEADVAKLKAEVRDLRVALVEHQEAMDEQNMKYRDASLWARLSAWANGR